MTWSTGHIDKFVALSANQIHFLKEGTSTENVIEVDEGIRLKERPITTSATFIENEELQLFPNPSTDWLSFHSSFRPVRIELLNTEGTVLTSFRDTQQISNMNISKLPDGIYLAKFWITDHYFVSRKWVKFTP